MVCGFASITPACRVVAFTLLMSKWPILGMHFTKQVQQVGLWMVWLLANTAGAV